MSSQEPRAAHLAEPKTSLLMRAAVVVAAAEALALVGYGIAIGIFAARTGGGKVSVAPVLVGLYAIFALLLAFVARGLWRRHHWARTPYVLAQVFALIVAYTLFHGSGVAPHVAGVIVGAFGVVGAVAGLSRQLGEGLS